MDDSPQTELCEDNEDDIEYIVERLETDEDETIEFDEKRKIVEVNLQQEEEKEMTDSQSNEDSMSVIKKIKLLPEVIYVINFARALKSNNLFSSCRFLYNSS